MIPKGTSYGAIKILGIPESQNPWWKGITRLDLANNHGYYQIGVRDGTIEGWNVYWDLQIKTSEQIQIIFEQVEGKSFIVLDKDGNIVKQIDLTQQSKIKLPNGLFSQGNAYFGTSTAPHGSLILTGLNVGILSDGKWIDNSDTELGLVELAKNHNLTLGTEFSSWNMSDIRYCQAMQKNFNVAAIGLFSWKGVWLGRGQYDFSTLDREVDYAISRGWRVRGFHLVWGAMESSAIPDWLSKGNFTRDEYINILEQHVKTLVGRYKGRVSEWSIANEASSRSFYAGSDFWNDKIGADYVEMAFRWAKETDPNSILIFNDFNNESPRDRDTSRVIDKMYFTVKSLKEKGVPIDVVGMQMHLLLKFSSPTAPKKDDVIATMQKFAGLGVRIYITEFDVDLTKRAGTQAEKWEYQAQLYRDMLQACLESKVCDSFATWGVSDSTSWITYQGEGALVNEPNADPLMFDKEFNPKPAYFAIRDVLLNFPNSSTP
jgi:endo-1,4-beta-xylanase